MARNSAIAEQELAGQGCSSPGFEAKKSQILLLYIFSTRFLFEESYEMEFPKGANMKPPRDSFIPLEAI